MKEQNKIAEEASPSEGIDSFVGRYLAETRRLLGEVDQSKVIEAIGWLQDARDRRQTVFACGNGGSAAIASQMVVDMVKCASLGKDTRFRMLCLSDNIETLTAYANDEGYETVFAEPLTNFAKKGDLLIAISGSGDSRNVLEAVRRASSMGMRSIALTSGLGGALREMVDLPLTVPSGHMGRLEDCFFALSHALAYAFIEDAV